MRLKPAQELRIDRHELAGSFGDIGVMAPLAVALITVNQLNATVVLGAAGLLYIFGGLYFRIPMPVQPLKATAAIALASWERISDGHLFSGGAPQHLDIGGALIPAGLLLGAVSAAIFLATRRRGKLPSSVAVLSFGALAGLALGGIGRDVLSLGPDLAVTGFPSRQEFHFALITLVLPQIPLTFGNSVVATADVSHRYFGPAAGRVTPSSLCASLGIANVIGGLVGAMPMCHGSGGITAHYRFGARTGGATIAIGAMFLLLALALGSSAVAILGMIPLAVLGFLLFYIGLEHALLARDLRNDLPGSILAAAVALASMVFGSLIWGLALGLAATGVKSLLARLLRPEAGCA
ncbi:MAG: hypothetical protein C4534_00665 [Gaiellales bacterium]|nr:MAG: hypothetical protein C4534_00665 [Gaiellales bacterium]